MLRSIYFTRALDTQVRRSAYAAMLRASQEQEDICKTFRSSKSLMHELLANGVHSSDHVVARASLRLLVALIPNTASAYRSFVSYLPHLQVLALKPDSFFKDDEGVLCRRVRVVRIVLLTSTHSYSLILFDQHSNTGTRIV